MRGLIQVVKHATVVVNNITIAEIQRGILALIGLEKKDTEEHAKKLVQRIIQYRIFSDQMGKTNLSLDKIEGGLLLVPQFTLVADTQKGLRPGFSNGMPPLEGELLFRFLVSYAKMQYPSVSCGKFGADMQVHLCNDGPMTFLLEV